MKFEVKTKPTKLSRDNINVWVKKNCKKDRKIFGDNLENSSEEYFGERNKEGKMDGMGVYNFVIEIDGVDTKERGQYYGEFVNGIMDGDGVLIRTNYTYVGKIKGTIKEGFGTLYINDGPTLIGDWENDKMHGNGRIIFPGGGDYTGEWKDGKMNGGGSRVELILGCMDKNSNNYNQLANVDDGSCGIPKVDQKPMKNINREFWLDEIKEYVINDMTENKELIDEYLGCLQILHINEWDVDKEDPYSWHDMQHRDMVEFEEIHQLEKHIGKEEVKVFLNLCKSGDSGVKNTHETALYTDSDDGTEVYLTSLIFTKEDFMELLMVDCDECYTKVAFCDSTPLEDYDDDWIRICKDCSDKKKE